MQSLILVIQTLHFRAAMNNNNSSSTCSRCGKSRNDFKGSTSNFYKHLRIHERDVDTSVACEVCGKVVSSRTSLAIHKKTHSEPQHVCSNCGAQFTQKWLLTKHIVTHNYNDKFTTF